MNGHVEHTGAGVDYYANKSRVPDSKVHGANMVPIWGRQDPDGPMLAPWTLLSRVTLNMNVGYSIVLLNGKFQ